MKPGLFVLAAGAAGLFFWAFPEVDLWTTDLFWRPEDGFFLRDALAFRLIHNGVPYLTSTIAIGLVLMAVTAWRQGKGRRVAVYLMLSLIAGPGVVVNTLLKDNWGRARPSQIVEFGGEKRFTPAPLIADQCARNCSFVAGDPGIGFWFLSVAFLLAGRARRIAIASAIGMGGFFGLARIAQGGHFFSDVVFCGFAVAATSWLLHRWIVEQRRFPMEPALRRLGLWTALAAAAIAASITWLDEPVARWAYEHIEILRPIFMPLANFGVSATYLITAAILFVALRFAARQTRFAAVADRLSLWSGRVGFVFAAIAASGLIVNLLKFVFGRPRPKLLLLGETAGFNWWEIDARYWSFPSGHAVTIVALLSALWWMWPQPIVLYVAFALVVIVSRVLVSAHYISDVVMSAYIAVVVTAYVRLLFVRNGIPLDDTAPGASESRTLAERLGLKRPRRSPGSL